MIWVSPLDTPFLLDRYPSDKLITRCWDPNRLALIYVGNQQQELRFLAVRPQEK